MKKSWKLILIALLAALLVCTCMSAMAETDVGHGDEVIPGHEGHETTVEIQSTVHDINGVVPDKQGAYAVQTYNVWCETCRYYVVQGATRTVFEPCTLGEVKNYKAATCTTDETWDRACTECGYVYHFVGQKATGHSWAPDNKGNTCTEAGYKREKCTECGAIRNETVLPAMGHIELTSDPTWNPGDLVCQVEGTVHVYCVRDKDGLGNEYHCDGYIVKIPPRDHLHLEDEWEYPTAYAPTCLKEGWRINRCKYCGGDVQKEVLPKVDHLFTVVVDSKDATCTTAGYVTYACAYGCGARKTVEIAALGHKASESWIWDRECATCTEDMNGKLLCSRCSAVLDTQVIPAVGHKWQLVREGDNKPIAATCTQPGYELYYCVNCWDGVQCTATKEEFPPAKGHDFKVETTPATCTADGKEVKTCKVCGTVVTDVLPALGHDYKTNTVAATCTKAGSETVVCSRCGDVKSTKEIAALGHKAGEAVVTKAATCTEAGEKTVKCTVCGEVLSTEAIPAAGHVPGKEKIEQNMGNTYCTVCGELLKQRKIPSSSGSSSSGSSASAASAPVIYNGAINAAGIAASELGGNGSALVTPIDLSTDGTFTYNLVAGDKYVVGTLTVTVSGGKATVSYAVKTGVTVSAEGLSIFANAEALKAGTATTAAFNAEIDPAGDTKIILAVNLVGSFDVSIADAYTADAAQIAAMKAIVD